MLRSSRGAGRGRVWIGFVLVALLCAVTVPADAAKHRKVAMFCTGGIRCEKASAFMLQEGFSEVYHLKGGILKYLEDIPEMESRWRGECFVFDERVALGHGLRESQSGTESQTELASSE